MRRLAVAILLTGCFAEPNYEGRFCEESAPCPSGFRCVDGLCTSRPPMALDSGSIEPKDASQEDAEPMDSTADAGSPDSDVAIDDAGTVDAGDPNLERCMDAPASPLSGWEARHFTLGAGFTLDTCFGVEDVAGDGIDRDYRGAGPFNGTIVDFGSRYTATRVFEAGIHTFTFTHDDGLRVLLDGKVVYEVWEHGYVAGASAFSEYLTAGQHLIEIEHFDDEGWAEIVVSWERGCTNLTTPTGAWLISYHGYQAMSGMLELEHCYGFETITPPLALSGVPAPVAALGVTTYGMVGRGIYDFDGMTMFDFGWADGLRVDVFGIRLLDDWSAGAPTTFTVQGYVPALAEISFTKFSTAPADLSISWRTVCEQSPPFGNDEWWVRYFRVLYTANPESWVFDRNDCLGSEIVSSDRLMRSGEPGPIAGLGLIDLWGAEYYGVRDFAQVTPVSITYDDGLRVFDGNTLWFEDWTAPQVGTNMLNFGAGTHVFRLEYFQNNGGAQIQFTW